MSEIKFRAFNKTVNKFTYFTGTPQIACDSNSGQAGMFLKAEGPVYLNEYQDPQQYTGLKDKHGKEMYEGDIITNYLDKSAIGIIEFGQYMKNVGFYVKWIAGIHKEFFHRELAFWEQITEVVGNIYENPKLLEVA